MFQVIVCLGKDVHRLIDHLRFDKSLQKSIRTNPELTKIHSDKFRALTNAELTKTHSYKCETTKAHSDKCRTYKNSFGQIQNLRKLIRTNPELTKSSFGRMQNLRKLIRTSAELTMIGRKFGQM